MLTVAGALIGCADRTGSAVARQPPADEAPEAAAVPRPDEWIVTPAGAGPLRIGMTLAELAPHLAADVDTGALGDTCEYVAVPAAPDSVGFMVERGRLVRVDVWGGETRTAEGARVGDSEARVLGLYPDARRLPHKYTDGSYLVAVPGAPEDTLGRYVFETDGRRVTAFRAGVSPQVEYVEGCA